MKKKKNKKSGSKKAVKQGRKAGAKGKKGKKGGISKANEDAIRELLERGRPRGFVTDNEILYYFPKIEDEVSLLDEIYSRLEKEGIKVIETSALIDFSKEELAQKELDDALAMEGEVPDAVQMYLKEIGKTPLLTKVDERELAKRAEKGDEDARQKLMKANLRLVVSIAKRYVNRTPHLSILDTTSVPVQALKGVTFDVEAKEFTAIVGPSGSGKTTLLNIVGGLDAVTGGSVHLNGSDVTTMKEGDLIDFRLHEIGFVFQAYNLIPVLTALENVEFVLFLQKVSRKERNERAVQLLERVGLIDRKNSKPSELSGGQQQRVAVARALASRPAFVLADEPTANLDSHTAESLLDLMQDLNNELGTTFLFSTHDSKVIRRARRVITLEDGMVSGDKSQTPGKATS